MIIKKESKFFNIFLSFQNLFKFSVFQLTCTTQPKYKVQYMTAEKEKVLQDARVT